MYDYLTESELEIEKDFRRNEVESLRLTNAMEAVVMRHELTINQIEAKAVFENYAEDRLVNEYTNEYYIYTEGVKDVWEKFKKLIKDIINAILGRKVDKDEALKSADVVEVPCEPNKLIQLVKDTTSAITNVLSLKKTNENGESEFDTKKFTIMGSSVIGVAGVVAAITNFKGVKTKVQVKLLPSIYDKLKSASQKLENVINNNVPKDGKIASAVQTAVTKLMNLVKKFLDIIANIINKLSKHENTQREVVQNGNSKPATPSESEKKDSESATPAGDKNGNSEPATTSEDEKTSRPEQDTGDKNDTTPTGRKRWDRKNPLSGMVKYSRAHNFVGMSPENAKTAKQKRNNKVTLTYKEFAAIYNAAKSNGDVSDEELRTWKDQINGKGKHDNVTVEFTEDDIVFVDSIYEKYNFDDIDHILDDDADSMFEATDNSIIDDINNIFDTFFN